VSVDTIPRGTCQVLPGVAASAQETGNTNCVWARRGSLPSGCGQPGWFRGKQLSQMWAIVLANATVPGANLQGADCIRMAIVKEQLVSEGWGGAHSLSCCSALPGAPPRLTVPLPTGRGPQPRPWLG